MKIRRLAGGILIILLGGCVAVVPGASRLRVAHFRADVTPDLGEPLIWVTPAEKVEDPLWAKGAVIEDGGTRIVLCAIDWCGLGGEAHLAFRSRIAEAAQIPVYHVALQAVHQHTAPYIDGDGYRFLAALSAPPLTMSPGCLDRTAGRIAAAVRDAIRRLEPFDRIGFGEARAERVASGRRLFKDGKLVTRYSTGGRDAEMAALPEGDIDPLLRTVTLAAGARPIVRLHYYATHPQTFCCDGRVSGDFAGLAREAVEVADGVAQIYFTGCAGDVTVGKYNDGSAEARAALRLRLESAMRAAIQATRFAPISSLRWRSANLALPLKTGAEFSPASLRRRLTGSAQVSGQELYRTAITLAFCERRRPLQATSLRLGDVWILNLPGEPMVEFQKNALELRPGSFVAVSGYGDISPGYLCTDRAYVEGGYEPGASNAGPGTEARLRKVIRKLLGR